jgi:cytidyltransferase-like protein
MQDFGAKIVTFEELDALRSHLGKIVMTSGGFDPIHPGHISVILESRKYGDTVVVVVNGDSFLETKKGKPFQDLATRCMIVSALREVDFVVPFEIKNDQTVAVAIDKIRPAVFTKGGDRITKDDLPPTEYEAIMRNNVKLVGGVGLDKLWSSSDFLKDWEEHAKKRG